MTLSIIAGHCCAECRLCRLLLTVTVFYKPLMLSVIMLYVIMMSAVMLNVVVHFRAILCLFYANSDANQADLRKISVINEQ